MPARKELLAAALFGVLGLLAAGAGLVADGPWHAAMVVALVLSSLAAGIGVWRASRAEAAVRAATRNDPLTRLPNASALRDDVTAFLQRPGDERRTLLIFDLVGFKKYNDAFGFACGDALLRRLAHKLTAAVGDRATAYRLRGGQFAILTRADRSVEVRRLAGDALFEVGEGFMIRCAQGSSTLPGSAADVSEALKLADQEVQAERATLRAQGIDDASIGAAPLAAPGHGARFDISDVAVAVGQCLGLTGADLDHVESAAALRDVGMMSVPDAVVQSPRRLTDEDWHFIQLHTLVGERLLRSNFGMDGVAAIVRSSHERWDGGGYPDGKAGEEIPLAARIVFVCGAFQDMTTQRPHRPALTAQQAVAELQRCAGTQFDPAVVAAFVGALSDHADAGGNAVGFGIA